MPAPKFRRFFCQMDFEDVLEGSYLFADSPRQAAEFYAERFEKLQLEDADHATVIVLADGCGYHQAEKFRIHVREQRVYSALRILEIGGAA